MSKYKEAGVNIDEQDKAISGIKQLVASTFTKNVVTGIGSFGAMFQVPKGYKNPILVASADGVGTKLKIAFMTDKHETIGQDLVNHCVDDILVQGAKPLYFLDYIATGKLAADVVVKIVEGLATACKENGFSLIGGEMAEMPGFYNANEYDVAGFITGIVDKDKVITGENIKDGDEVWGFCSTGLHTNGYSLARKIIFDNLKLKIDSYIDDLGETVGDALLKIHKSYYPVLIDAIEHNLIKGLAHITGGGFIDNIPRVLPDNLNVIIEKNKIPTLPIFDFLVKHGKIDNMEKYRVFNMGIGMVAFVSKENKDKFLNKVKEQPVLIGQVTKGNKKVEMV
jgi:phosphoribosylformylglycinamidine cyclo-ligase